MGGLIGKIWAWPDGLLWRGALATGRRMRQRRMANFLRFFAPGPAARTLDVGVCARTGGGANFFETAYPFAESLTCCGIEGEPEICRQRGIRFVSADGCDLPFAEGEFDIVHSNAVIEHVGGRARQRRFVAEMCRVGRRVWLATPDADSPLEAHTLLPCVHWLPERLRNAIYILAGRGDYAGQENLNLLTAGDLRRLFPPAVQPAVEIRRQYLMGLPAVLVATLKPE